MDALKKLQNETTQEMTNTVIAKVNETYKNGKREGVRETWYGNGQLWFRANYKNGKLNGLFEDWDINSKQLSMVTYKNGVAVE